MKNGCAGLAQALAARWRVECPVIAKNGTLSYAPETGAESLPEVPRQGRGKKKFTG